VVNQF